MKLRMRKSFLFFTLFLAQFSSPINTRYIKDTYTILKPEYKHLSPANGAVWWYKGIVENMYTYGGVKLTQFLFHPVQGSFNVTRASGSVATYFTPKTVGGLLGEIEKVKPAIQKIVQDKKKDAWKKTELDKLQDKLKKDLANVLAKDEGYKAGVAGYLGSIQGDRTKLGYFSSNQKGLLAAIVNLLEDSGFFEIKGKRSEAIYPFYTAYDVLLTFLFRKAEDVKAGANVDKLDYKEYFEGLRIQLGDAIFTEPGLKLLESEAWLHDVYDDSEAALGTYLQEISNAISKANPLDAELLDQLYEKIVFADLSRPKELPNLAQYRDSFYEGQPFPDCVDTTMRNLCNIVVFEKKTNTFNLAMIKDVHPDAACRDFYSNELYKKATEIENPLVHDAWPQVVENRPYISYNRVLRKKDRAVFCCALRDNDPFYGFMLNSNALKDKAKEKITISFEDGSNETFDLLEMNGHKFALVDSEQFAPFEIMPSLKNVIILMNGLFGLHLYENLETAFFEEDFDTTYFPMIAKRFNWKYTSSSENLDQSDYKNIEIKVKIKSKTGAGSFTLSLEFDTQEVFGHGQLILESAVSFEPYQELVFKFARTQLVELAQAQQLDTHSSLFDLFALYQKPNSFEDTISLFKDYGALNNFVYFIQRLQDPNRKLEIIKLIIKSENSSMYGLCAGLIKSMPIAGDLYALKALAKIDFAKVLSNKNSGSIKEALLKMYDSMLKRPIDSDTVNVVERFVSKIDLFDEKAIDLVRESVMNTDSKVSEGSQRLVSELVKKGKGYITFLEIAQKLIENEDEQKGRGLLILREFVKQGKGIEEAIRAVNKVAGSTADSDINALLELLAELVNQGQAYNQAIQAATNGFNNSDSIIKENATILFVNLILKGQAYNEAIEVATKGFNNPGTHYNAMKVLGKLIDNGQAYDQAIQLATNGLSNQDTKDEAFELINRLIMKGQAYDLAIQTATNMLSDWNTKVRALELFGVLFEKGQGFAQAIQLATSKLSDPGTRVQGLELLGKLVDNGQGFDQAIQAATNWFSNSDFQTRYEAQRLFVSLIQKGQGFDQAMRIASNGLNDSNTRYAAMWLFAELMKKGQGFEQAIQLARNNFENVSAVFLESVSNQDFSLVESIMLIFAKLAEGKENKELLPIVKKALESGRTHKIDRDWGGVFESLLDHGQGYELLKQIVQSYENSQDPNLKAFASGLKEKLKAKGINF
jgi:hypothetical protein